MADFLVALGLAFVIEGALYALAPTQMRDMMARMLSLPTGQIRIAGLVLAVFGFLVIATLKG